MKCKNCIRNLLKIILGLIYFVGAIAFNKSIAQVPDNDSCYKAVNINLPNGGYFHGTVRTDSIDISNATIESGENFHSSIVTTGLDKKSIWFKFYMPARRGVKIELKQPANAIATTDVGFTTYYSDSCLPPLSAINPAKITPINQFGNSSNPCMDPGWYMIQVSSKSRAKGKVYLELSFTYPFESASVMNSKYDSQDSAYLYDSKIGLDGIREVTASIELGCYTIEDSSELFAQLGSDYNKYTQSVWLVFRAVDDADYLFLYINQPLHLPVKFGVRFFNGDCRLNKNSLKLLDSAVFNNNSYPCNSSAEYLTEKCNIDSGEFYTVQLLFHESEVMQIGFVLKSHRSDLRTYATTPLKGLLTGRNNVGNISESGLVIIESAFTCESSVDNNSCKKIFSNNVKFNGLDYNLSEWYRFNLKNRHSLRIYSNYTGRAKLIIRVYSSLPLDSCDSLDSASLLKGFMEQIDLACLDTGSYLVQVLASDSSMGYPGCGIRTSLGEEYSIYFNFKRVLDRNHFSLGDTGLIDSVNSINDTLSPLPQNSWIFSHADTFGCRTTILPDSKCDSSYDRGIYRVFKIGDVDADNVLDSGLLTISHMAYSRPSGGIFDKILYKGSAMELANRYKTYSYGDTLRGLNRLAKCYRTPYTYVASVASICVTPGEYTFLTLGNEGDIGGRDKPKFRFTKTELKFHIPQSPQVLDTLEVGKVYTTERLRYSCYDNADSIDGLKCGKKAFYHVFYVSDKCLVSIQRLNSLCLFSLFKGDSRNGLNSLKVYSDNSGEWDCLEGKTSNECDPISAGWYTVVCWDDHWSFGDSLMSDAYRDNGSLESEHFWLSQCQIELQSITQPKYNRPSKAAVANNGQPLNYVNKGTRAYPNTGTSYIFPKEYSNCIPDTPFSSHPINGCNINFDHIAYYVFKLSQESYLKITGVPTKVKIYNFDVRVDSMLMDSIAPIQNCNYNSGWLEFCRMEPGIYSMVVFYEKQSSLDGIEAYVDSVGYSKFDFAWNAYDFDIVPGDNHWYSGKLDDYNRFDSLRAPSSDFIFCTTGFSISDPSGITCRPYVLSPFILQNKVNQSFFPSDSAYTVWNGKNYYYYGDQYRNLWYTFRLKGSGNLKCKVSVKGKLNLNKGYTGFQGIGLQIFRSDENGALSFDSLKNVGGVDSTLGQGLVPISSNSSKCQYWIYDYCCTSSELSFDVSQLYCDSASYDGYTRYYLLLNMAYYKLWNGIPLPGDFPNQHLQIELKYDSFVYPQTNSRVFDHFSSAQLINGDLYRDTILLDSVLLSRKIYSGSRSVLQKASVDTSDFHQNSCTDSRKSIWYKFRVDSTGILNVALRMYRRNHAENSWYFFKDRVTSNCYSRLLKAHSSFDSLSGLEVVPFNGEYIQFGKKWGRACVSPGWYYINIKNDPSYECTDYIIPEFIVNYQSADFCFNASELVINGLGVESKRTNLNCHTIGTDYGEDGSNMGCLPGPAGYKSTWFKINYTDTTKINISFNLKNYTSVSASDIKYRAFYGNCSSLTPAPCNTNSQTTFTLNCMTEGLYFIQVISPEDATGEVELEVIASENKDTTCNPVNTLKPTANFYLEINCPKNIVNFYNSSSRGDSIAYLWDFGNGQTETAVNQRITYPALTFDTIYQVFLRVTHIGNGFYDTITQNVFVPAVPEIHMIPNGDTAICIGDSLSIRSLSSFGSRLWSTKDTTTMINVYPVSNKKYFIQTTHDGCVYSDSLYVIVNPLPNINLGNDTLICWSDSLKLDAGFGMSEYLWQNNSKHPIYYAKGEEGLIYVQITDSNSCVNSDTVELLPNANLDTLLGEQNSVCKNIDSVILNVQIGNGWFQNTAYLDSSGTFRPQISGSGFIEVYYSIIDSIQCYRKDSAIIQVDTIPEASITASGPWCENSDIVLITPKINSGGVFYGGSYVDSIGYFNPAIAKDGLHKIYYTFTDGNSCTNVDSALIRVDTIPDASISPAGPFCANGQIELLNPRFNYGGEFSGGNYIDSTGAFNPKISGSGYHKVYYSFSDGNYCINTDSAEIEVYFVKSFNPLEDTTRRCGNSTYLLADSGYVSYKWNTSDSASTILLDRWGSYTVKVIDSNGCVNIDSTVLSLVNADIIQGDSSICFGDSMLLDVDTKHISQSRIVYSTDFENGKLTGFKNGVISNFNGTKVLGRYAQSGAWLSINNLKSHDSIKISFDLYIHDTWDGDLASQGPDIWQLSVDSNLIYKTTFSQVWNCTQAYPGQYPASKGKYPYKSGAIKTGLPQACTSGWNTTQYKISVVLPHRGLNLEIEFRDSVNEGQCNESWSLDNLVVQQIAVRSVKVLWSTGDTTSSVLVSPEHDSTYFVSVSDGITSCIDSLIVKVDLLPDASISPAGPYCMNDSVQLISPKTNSGGFFTPTLFLDSTGNFNPWLAMVGNHKILYNFTDSNGCYNWDSSIISIDSVPDVSIEPVGPYCHDESAVILSGLYNNGGIYSGGTFVDSIGIFYPTNGSVGINRIYREYTDGNGCKNNDSLDITIDSLPIVNITYPGLICEDHGSISLISNKSGGYFFGGTYVDSAGIFSPTIAGRGDHLVFFNYTDGNGCSNYDSLYVRVDTVPNASIVANGPYCWNDEGITLKPEFNSGGRFYGGSFIDSVGLFTPSMANIGPNKVYYSITNGFGCFGLDSTIVVIDSVPDASIVPTGPYCLNAGDQIIIAKVNSGGVFKGGNYIDSTGLFSLNSAGVGDWKVIYEFMDGNQCFASDSIVIVVDSLPDASILDPKRICVDHGLVIMSPKVNLGGKFFGGTFIDSGGIINPAISGVGNHKFYYTLTDGSGCTSFDSNYIQVDSLPNAAITPAGPFCTNAGNQVITPLLHQNGKFSGGSYIDSNGTFNPAVAMIGDHKIYYQLSDGLGCEGIDSIIIHVDSIPNASIVFAGPFCQNGSSSVIKTSGLIGGYYFGGAYIDSSGLLTPSLASVGKHFIYYFVTDDMGCSNTDSLQILVDSIPNAEIKPHANTCANIDTIHLTPKINKDGKFYGSSFIDSTGVFHPKNSGVGNFKVFYTITDASACTNFDSTVVVVDTIPNASIVPAGPFCMNSGLQNLSARTNPSGMFDSSAYLSSTGLFNPILASPGLNRVKYTFVDQNGCVSSDSLDVEVDTIPDASFYPVDPLCENEEFYIIQPVINSGGNFLGNGVTLNGVFDPNIAKPGVHRILYSFTDGEGCTASDSIDVVVMKKPDATLNQIGPFCKNEPETNVLPITSGGTFKTELYLTSDGRFNPANAYPGTNKIIYYLQDNNGCSDTGMIDILVFDIPFNEIDIDPTEGCEPLTVYFSTDPESSIEWRINQEIISDQDKFSDSFGVGMYIVELSVTNSNNCSITLDTSFEVYSNPIASFDFEPKTILNSNAVVNFKDLSSGSVNQWTWFFGDMGTSTEQHPIHEYDTSGIYSVILRIEDANTCFDTTYKTLIVLDDLFLTIPNSFSPNRDKLNPTFRVHGVGFAQISCKIYNRWGEKIFDEADFKSWDGTYQGVDVPQGVYTYTMVVRKHNGQFEYKRGTITLLR